MSSKTISALDSDGDLASVVAWIAEAEREQKSLQGQLGREVVGRKLTASQVRVLVDTVRDIVSVLATADGEDKAALYKELGINLTYHSEGRVAIEALPRGVQVRVGGLFGTSSTRTAPLRRWCDVPARPM